MGGVFKWAGSRDGGGDMQVLMFLLCGLLFGPLWAEHKKSEHFDSSIGNDLSRCIQISNVECVRAYCEQHPELAGSWSIRDRSSTREALEARRLSPSKTRSLAVLQILLEHGAPIAYEDFVYAYGDGAVVLDALVHKQAKSQSPQSSASRRQYPVDTEALRLLLARVEFLKYLKAVAALHKKHNTDPNFFVHWPKSTLDEQRQALPPKNILVYQDMISQINWRQTRYAEGDTELTELSEGIQTTLSTRTKNITEYKWSTPEPQEGWRLWQQVNWPAVVTPSDVHQMAGAVLKGDFNHVVDVVLHNPYVVHATPAQDMNMVIPTAFSLLYLEQPRESFLGQALLHGHREIARFLLEFQAELLPIENRHGRSEYIALQALDKQLPVGRIDWFWRAESKAPDLGRVQELLNRLPGDDEFGDLKHGGLWPGLLGGELYQGLSKSVVQKWRLHTHPLYKEDCVDALMDSSNT